MAFTTDDQQALFQRWVADHGGIVLKVARAYTLTAADCQDLTQEILLALWRSLTRFESRASPSTWIYRVALNTALAWHGKERRRRTRQHPLFDLAEVPARESDDTASSRESVARLYEAIRQLPKSDAALVLLYLDGLSYRQMSEVLGISESNVGVKLNRAKKALTKRLNEAHHER